MPKAIRQAASLWRVKAEEIMQPEQQCKEEKEEELRWEWERELTSRVLDPAHYLRILDRVCGERAAMLLILQSSR
jgi:hypothetical protein